MTTAAAAACDSFLFAALPKCQDFMRLGACFFALHLRLFITSCTLPPSVYGAFFAYMLRTVLRIVIPDLHLTLEITALEPSPRLARL
jgi:hypothetical protein